MWIVLSIILAITAIYLTVVVIAFTLATLVWLVDQMEALLIWLWRRR